MHVASRKLTIVTRRYIFTKIIGNIPSLTTITNDSSVALSKTPILIYHGLFGSGRNWQSVGKILADELQQPVVLADLRNHGHSVAFDTEESGRPGFAPMTWELMADDIEDTINSLSLDFTKKVILMGHSLGGQVIMEALFKRPSLRAKVQKSIIVDIAPVPLRFEQSMLNKYLDKMIEIDNDKLDRREAMDAFRKVETNEQIVQFIFTNYGKLSPTINTEKENKMGFLLPLSGIKKAMIELGKTQSVNNNAATTNPLMHLGVNALKLPLKDLPPTLFIKGEKSGYINDPGLQAIGTLFSNYKIQTIPNAGHWVHHEAPTSFVNVVKTFIQSSDNNNCQ